MWAPAKLHPFNSRFIRVIPTDDLHQCNECYSTTDITDTGTDASCREKAETYFSRLLFLLPPPRWFMKTSARNQLEIRSVDGDEESVLPPSAAAERTDRRPLLDPPPRPQPCYLRSARPHRPFGFIRTFPSSLRSTLFVIFVSISLDFLRVFGSDSEVRLRFKGSSGF